MKIFTGFMVVLSVFAFMTVAQAVMQIDAKAYHEQRQLEKQRRAQMPAVKPVGPSVAVAPVVAEAPAVVEAPATVPEAVAEVVVNALINSALPVATK